MTGRYWDDSETMSKRIHRALVVQEFGDSDVDALEYIAKSKGWD
jgi:hypothetical protein